MKTAKAIILMEYLKTLKDLTIQGIVNYDIDKNYFNEYKKFILNDTKDMSSIGTEYFQKLGQEHIDIIKRRLPSAKTGDLNGNLNDTGQLANNIILMQFLPTFLAEIAEKNTSEVTQNTQQKEPFTNTTQPGLDENAKNEIKEIGQVFKNANISENISIKGADDALLVTPSSQSLRSPSSKSNGNEQNL